MGGETNYCCQYSQFKLVFAVTEIDETKQTTNPVSLQELFDERRRGKTCFSSSSEPSDVRVDDAVGGGRELVILTRGGMGVGRCCMSG